MLTIISVAMPSAACRRGKQQQGEVVCAISLFCSVALEQTTIGYAIIKRNEVIVFRLEHALSSASLNLRVFGPCYI